MKTLDQAIECLCEEVTKIVNGEPVDFKRKKWVRTAEGTICPDCIDYETIFAISVHDKKLINTEPYCIVVEYLKNNPPFSTATNTIGFTGQPHNIIQKILSDAMSVDNDKIMVDPDVAKSALKNFITYLNSQEISYEAKCRLVGVKLTSTSISISDEIQLIKLTDEELNERQPYTDAPHSIFGFYLLEHDTEVRFTLTIIVNTNDELPLLATMNSAQSEMNCYLEDIISTLRLCKPGIVELGPRGASSFVVDTAAYFGTEALPVVWNLSKMEIGDSDIELLQESYRLIRECRLNDKILDRALHRFLLARQRQNLYDRLVDFVISWESILLTVNNNAIQDELSYRFSINGANILKASNAETNCHIGHRLMKMVYSIRSSIVHGASNDDIKKELTKLHIDSMDSLLVTIEDKLRQVIFWISKLDLKDRPYIKLGGWEQLLWGNG